MNNYIVTEDNASDVLASIAKAVEEETTAKVIEMSPVREFAIAA